MAIDLDGPGWKPYKQPYLWSLHSSAIMCSYHVNNVPEQFWNKIKDAGDAQMNNYSDMVSRERRWWCYSLSLVVRFTLKLRTFEF